MLCLAGGCLIAHLSRCTSSLFLPPHSNPYTTLAHTRAHTHTHAKRTHTVHTKRDTQEFSVVCVCIGKSEAGADDVDGDDMEEKETEKVEEDRSRRKRKRVSSGSGGEFGNVHTRTQQQQHAHQRQPTTLFNSSFGSLIGVVNVMFGWWLFDCPPQSLYVFPLSPSPQQSVHHTRTNTRTHTHTHTPNARTQALSMQKRNPVQRFDSLLSSACWGATEVARA
jgi:hypothetical protein